MRFPFYWLVFLALLVSPAQAQKSPISPLARAVVKDHNLKAARQLLEKGAPIEKFGPTLLRFALRDGDAALFAVLDKRGLVPAKLTFSAFGPFEEPTSPFAVRILLARGANPNEKLPRTYPGWTILHSAIYDGQLESVKLLLDAGADPNARGDFWESVTESEKIRDATPAFLMALQRSNDDEAILRLLLERGADPNARETEHGYSLITWMAVISRSASPRQIALLLRAGADPTRLDNSGQTALHLAAINDDASSARELLKSNRTPAFINARDKNGRTALFRAVAPLSTGPMEERRANRIENAHPLLKVLLDAGADPTIPDQNGNTIWHALLDATLTSPDSALVYLAKIRGVRGFDLPNKRGETPLWKACRFSNLEVARWLLFLGANPDVPDQKGVTPRQIVAGTAKMPLTAPGLFGAYIKQRPDFRLVWEKKMAEDRRAIFRSMKPKNFGR